MGKKGILVITEDDVLKQKLSDEFQGEHYIVETIQKQSQGLELLRDNIYSVIIDDIGGGVDKSYSLLHKVSVNQYSANVVVLVEDIMAEDILMAYELGAVDIFDKHYELGQIKSLVNSLHNN